MLTPRSRKPVSIPSLPPVEPEVRKAGLFRRRGPGGVSHRRLSARHDAESAPAGSTGGPPQPGSTFHGATARWVAFG